MSHDSNDLNKIREAAEQAIHPICQITDQTNAEDNFWFNAKRTDAGRSLPDYQLVYFLLIDLLKFKHSGQGEKIAWSVPIDYKGQAFLIEHRKFGVGVFTTVGKDKEVLAEEIVTSIKKGIKVAEPFFEILADEAVNQSKLNVINNSDSLFERYEYFLGMYKKVSNEALERADECEKAEESHDENVTSISYSFPSHELSNNAQWLGLAAIDAFFSWTEHIFIHIAILSGRITTGIEVANLADDYWKNKFKKAIDLEEADIRPLYDELILIRNQIRNFMAHGAFGKRGEAFKFHSGAGAVPVLFPHQHGKPRFALIGAIGFNEATAIEVINKFIQCLWSGNREPAKHYIQECGFPSILPMANDGTYSKAMQSMEDMQKLTERLGYRFDQAANMDW